jgi:hypothetical protein
MGKLAVSVLALFWLLTFGGAFQRATLVAAPPAPPSQITGLYSNDSPTMGLRRLPRITRPFLQWSGQSSNELSAGLNEQRQGPRRIRRGEQPSSLSAPPFAAPILSSAKRFDKLQSADAGFRYGRSPPEA